MYQLSAFVRDVSVVMASFKAVMPSAFMYIIERRDGIREKSDPRKSIIYAAASVAKEYVVDALDEWVYWGMPKNCSVWPGCEH